MQKVQSHLHPMGPSLTLPFGFKRLKYIESTRLQIINLGQYPLQFSSLVITLHGDDWTKTHLSKEYIFGSGTGFAGAIGWDGNIHYGGKITLVGGNTVITATSNRAHLNYDVWLFARNFHGLPYESSKSSEIARCKAKLMSVIGTVNGVTVLDLIPVLDSNGVPCVYNRVKSVVLYDMVGEAPFKYELS